MADHGPSEGCWITETEVSSQEPRKQPRKNNWGKDDAHPIFVVSVIKRLGFIYLIHPYSLLKSCLLIYSEFEHTLLYIYHIHIQMIGTQVLANNLQVFTIYLLINTGTETEYDSVPADVQEIYRATEQNQTGNICQREGWIQRQEQTTPTK